MKKVTPKIRNRGFYGAISIFSGLYPARENFVGFYRRNYGMAT